MGEAMIAFVVAALVLYLLTDKRRTARTEAWRNNFYAESVDRYGDAHIELREAFSHLVHAGGAVCAERICVRPARSIDPTDRWHLAHDHVAGGAFDYLGPAHAECNENEALVRGVTWPGMPDLSVSSTRQGGRAGCSSEDLVVGSDGVETNLQVARQMIEMLGREMARREISGVHGSPRIQEISWGPADSWSKPEGLQIASARFWMKRRRTPHLADGLPGRLQIECSWDEKTIRWINTCGNFDRLEWMKLEAEALDLTPERMYACEENRMIEIDMADVNVGDAPRFDIYTAREPHRDVQYVVLREGVTLESVNRALMLLSGSAEVWADEYQSLNVEVDEQIEFHRKFGGCRSDIDHYYR